MKFTQYMFKIYTREKRKSGEAEEKNMNIKRSTASDENA